MHMDISPANVVVSSAGAPCLVDFSLATSLAELRLEFVAQSRIEGTLAYLAPEQTGRTGRPADRHSEPATRCASSTTNWRASPRPRCS
jgi:serine/threonine protein kinase